MPGMKRKQSVPNNALIVHGEIGSNFSISCEAHTDKEIGEQVVYLKALQHGGAGQVGHSCSKGLSLAHVGGHHIKGHQGCHVTAAGPSPRGAAGQPTGHLGQATGDNRGVEGGLHTQGCGSTGGKGGGLQCSCLHIAQLQLGLDQLTSIAWPWCWCWHKAD